MRRRSIALTLLVGTALSLAACGGDEETSSTTSTSTGAAAEGAEPDNDVFIGTIAAATVDGGVLVQSLEVGSPLEGAGLRGRDVIVAVDGAPIETTDDLAEAIAGLGETYNGGDQVELGIVRDTKDKTLTVTLAGNVYLAVEISDAPKNGGALVNAVPKAGPADKAGIEPGDVIVAVDGESVTDVDSLLAVLAPHVAGDEVEIEVSRGSKERTLTATLEKRVYGQVKARSG